MDDLIKFTEFYHKFQQTKRKLYATGEDRFENDSEHSYQVALTCWYLINKYKLDLNIEKVLKYSIAHDLPEAITTDFYFLLDKETKAKKVQLEKDAVEKIIEEFPGFFELKETLESYELKADEEAKFVNAVEKIIPVINIFLDDGRTWKEEGMTFDLLAGNKDVKTSIHPLAKSLWQEFREIIKKSKLLA